MSSSWKRVAFDGRPDAKIIVQPPVFSAQAAREGSPVTTPGNQPRLTRSRPQDHRNWGQLYSRQDFAVRVE